MFEELFSLKGKTAIVTGASSGLGREFALTLAKAGSYVIAIGRNKAKLEELSVQTGGAYYIVDFNDIKIVKDQFAKILADHPKIDILVNNAGIADFNSILSGSPFEDFEKDYNIWQETNNVNLLSLWFITKFVTSFMTSMKIEGSIINIASIVGNIPAYNMSAYSASKAAVINLTRQFAIALAPHKIRVNSILPGWVETNMTEQYLNQGGRTAAESSIPLGFVATPKDFRASILFLASNAASAYVTGADFTLDGGGSWNRKQS